MCSDKFPGGSDFCWSNPQGIPAASPLGKYIDRRISVTHFQPANFAEYNAIPFQWLYMHDYVRMFSDIVSDSFKVVKIF